MALTEEQRVRLAIAIVRGIAAKTGGAVITDRGVVLLDHEPPSKGLFVLVPDDKDANNV